MTNYIKLLFITILSFSISLGQTANTIAEINIKTSAVCDMCKQTLEKAMAYEKGVKKSTLDVGTKILCVVYNPKKTTPEKIKKAISETGYDADEITANQRAYNKLNACCKKDAHQNK